jgi:hypothetical protein
MKTITINVSEPVYREFQEYARRHDRTTSELIREAMEQYRLQKIHPRGTLRNLEPSSVGTVLREFQRDDDLLEEMLNDPGR